MVAGKSNAFAPRAPGFFLLVVAALTASAASADSRPPPAVAPSGASSVSYPDLVGLADSTPLIIRALPRKIAAVEPARARNLRPGWGRFYVEAKTEALIAGTASLGEALRYLVDLPLDAKGKPPAFKKKSVVLFARTVPDHPGDLQLVVPDAQLLWDAALDLRIRNVVRELIAPGAPPRMTGVREAVHVSADLAGAGETQIFLQSASGEPAAITVSRQPGAAPHWGVSFSELVANDTAPRRDTLGWYRLACFLPPVLPAAANVAGDQVDRAAAAQDYAFVRDQLGDCVRNRL